MTVNGWISNLTKNTASARMNFPSNMTDPEIIAATKNALMAELREQGRVAEANPAQWELKGEKIDRAFSIIGRSSARIRLVKRKDK